MDDASTADASNSNWKQPCFVENARDSGTDLNDSIIMKTKTVDADSCQTRCQAHDDCNYFLYLTRNHPQWYKRRECRLLRRTGILTNEDEHVSGPKNCNLTLWNLDYSLNSHSPNSTDISDGTTHRNLTHLVDDFLSLICKFQVFSGKTIN